jgi:hypothetical protein
MNVIAPIGLAAKWTIGMTKLYAMLGRDWKYCQVKGTIDFYVAEELISRGWASHVALAVILDRYGGDDGGAIGVLDEVAEPPKSSGAPSDRAVSQ